MQIVIPMAGRGQRFKEAGYLLPKPLINVNGKTMIQRVIENINIDAHYIFIVLKEHYDAYDLKTILPKYCKSCEIIVAEKVTDGAARHALLAKYLIDNDKELIIANSDQLLEWHYNHFLDFVYKYEADGGIITFNASGPKWSYAAVNEDGVITKVAEKIEISKIATCGLYYFKHGKDFVSAAETMIKKNIRTNGDFYICPVYNELIEEGKTILNYPIPRMFGLGTPEDLEKYLGNND